MPVELSAGHGLSTPEKQRRVREILRTIMVIHWGTRRAYPGWADMLMLDLTAGLPWYEDGVPGSSWLITELVAELGTRAHLLCCERDAATCCVLRERGYAVMEGDHHETVPRWASSLNGRRFLGLGYFDPNGADAMPLDVFDCLVKNKATERMDLLANVNTKGRGRGRGSYRSPNPKATVKQEPPWLRDEVEHLLDLKKKVLICPPFGQHGWSLVFASNLPRLTFKGFFDVMTFEGQQIIDKIDRMGA